MTAGDAGLTRRRFLARSAALGAGALWAPAFELTPASAQAGCPVPPDFPASIELYRQAFENWAGEIRVDDLWTCVPRTPGDVVTLANWAHAEGYRLRPRGLMHNWSPLTVTPDTGCDARVVLVDTTRHLTQMGVVHSSAAVRVGTGASMEALLGFLERAGHGLAAAPAPGDLTVGGVLAIDAHGSAVPALGETRVPGHAYGSLSNLVLSLTAVVWDRALGRYALRTFDRSDPDSKALLTHLGRAFVTEATLQVGPNYNLRCVSYTDVAARELFASPASAGVRSLASYVDGAGRVEAIWFAFTTKPWLKLWSLSPRKPPRSRAVSSPYNYPFSDNIPKELALLGDRIVKGEGSLTPTLGQLEYLGTVAGLAATRSSDIWGLSKNLLLYVKPTTLRLTTSGYAVLTRRSDLQRVVSEFASFYRGRLDVYRSRGSYPINGPVEIRVTGLDTPSDVELRPADSPVLSALRPRPDHPDWDVAVWLNVLTFPGTPESTRFYRELEAWLFRNYSGSYAAVRPEWSKGWAYTDSAAWADTATLTGTVPNAYRAGRGPSDDWDWALATLNGYDPQRIFSNAFLDTLLR